MYFPTTFTTPAPDPIERERILTGRPESRWEIAQRHHHVSRLHAPLLTRDEESSAADTGTHSIPNAVSGIRRALSRVLITTGERIDPKAA